MAVFIVIGAILTGMTGGTEEPAADNKENNSNLNEDENEKNNNEKDNDEMEEIYNEKNNNVANEEEQGLTEEQVTQLESELESSLENERDSGEKFYLIEFDYDPETEIIAARVDMQKDPLPDTKEDVEEWAQTWASSLAEAAPELEDRFHVRVTLVSKIEPGEFLLWGHSTYDYNSEEYDFSEENAMRFYE